MSDSFVGRVIDFIGNVIDPPPGPAQPGREQQPRDWGTIALDTAIGAVVLLVVFSLTMGGVRAAAQVLALVVVCTFGFGLVILLGLAWVTGTVVRRPIAHLLRAAFGVRRA
jgi:hypothetical protein